MRGIVLQACLILSILGCGRTEENNSASKNEFFTEDFVVAHARTGMPRDEVIEIFGEPSVIYNENDSERFVYGITPQEPTLGQFVGFTLIIQNGQLKNHERFTYAMDRMP